MGLVIAYAQPKSDEPFLSLKDIKKGKVIPTKKTVWSTLLNLTDVGWAVWQSANSIDANLKIQFNKIPFFQRETTDPEQTQWDLEIVVSNFILVMKSRRYLPVKEDASAFYITLELRGDDAAISAFLKTMVQALGHSPIEFADLPKLAKKVEVPEERILKTWVEFAGVTIETPAPTPTAPAAQAGAATGDNVIITKVNNAIEELKKFCTNPSVHQTFETAVQNQVAAMIGSGQLDRAKGNAVTIIKKVRAMKDKYEATMKTLDKLHERIRHLEDEGMDIMPPLTAMIAAEKALKDNDYQGLKVKFDEAKAIVAALIAGATGTAPATAAVEPATSAASAAEPEKKLQSYDMALRGGTDEVEAQRPDVEDITTFVVCKKCKTVLGKRPLWQCPECGKRYHQDCAKSLTRCLVCLAMYDGIKPGEEPEKKEEPVKEEPAEAEEIDMSGMLEEEIEVKDKPTTIDDEFDAFLKEIDEL